MTERLESLKVIPSLQIESSISQKVKQKGRNVLREFLAEYALLRIMECFFASGWIVRCQVYL
jgi:hypothetical protein